MTTVRQRLINSGSTLFAEKGYHGVSTREISAHAQANVSLLSFYFGGKSGLLRTILQGLIEAGVNETESHLIPATNKDEFTHRLKEFLKSLTNFQIKNADLLKIYFQELEAGNVDAVEVNGYALGGVWAKLNIFVSRAHDLKIINSPSSEATSMAIIAPFLILLQNKNCTEALIHLSLNDRKFSQQLIESVVRQVAATA